MPLYRLLLGFSCSQPPAQRIARTLGVGVEAHFRLEALVLEVLFVRVEPFVGYLPKNHLRFGVSIFRFRVSGFDFQVWGLGFRVSGFGFRFRFSVYGLVGVEPFVGHLPENHLR